MNRNQLKLIFEHQRNSNLEMGMSRSRRLTNKRV